MNEVYTSFLASCSFPQTIKSEVIEIDDSYWGRRQQKRKEKQMEEKNVLDKDNDDEEE